VLFDCTGEGLIVEVIAHEACQPGVLLDGEASMAPSPGRHEKRLLPAMKERGGKSEKPGQGCAYGIRLSIYHRDCSSAILLCAAL
jgi:hypothetical protein